jgi:hypothetical protein
MRYCMLFVIVLYLPPSVATAYDGRQVQKLPLQELGRPHAASTVSSTCVLQAHNDTANSYFGSFATGDRIAVYIDPSICEAATYPFNIEGIYLTLYGGTAVWPVHLAVEIWSAKTNGACGGPNSLLYSESYSLTAADFKFDTIGALAFSDTVCVTGPFFAVVEYTGGTSTPYPSIIFDSDLPGDTCGNWGYLAGMGWYKWSDYWADPIPGNCILWVQGETKSALCANSCCTGTTGNVNMTDGIDVSDLSSLVSYVSGGSYILPCPNEANVNGIGSIDVSDLSALVYYLSGADYTFPNCP